MWIVRVKDRGRDLVYHQLETAPDAEEIARVYRDLGYSPEKILIERIERKQARAA